MNWKKIADWYHDEIWWRFYNSKFYHKYIDVKYFLINSWKYRKELSSTYHDDYYLDLFKLIHRYNQEFSEECILNCRNYRTPRNYRKELIKFYTMKELSKRLRNDSYAIQNFMGDRAVLKGIHTDKLDKQKRDFNMLFEYIRKYSGRWWL